MNVVHAVLRNWDIQQVIINFVKDDVERPSRLWRRRDLVAVALVCRALSDLPLNALWRDANLEKIYSLFPMDTNRTDGPGDRMSLSRIPTAPEEWERFDAYASRIRELSASPSPNNPFLRGLLIRYPTPHHPFPNLTFLGWSSTPSAVPYALTLISPTLAHVMLSIDELGADVENDDYAVALLFRLIGERCSHLKKLDYLHRSIPENRSKAIDVSLTYLIRQCRRLEDIRLPASRDILRSLATLPHLSTLILNYAKWEDGSQLAPATEVDEMIEEADIYPVLDDLTIEGSHTVSSLAECFQGSGCFPRKSFTMCEISESDQWSTLAIAEFFRGILRPDRSERLLVFLIDRDAYSVENPFEHGSWQAIRSLSFIPNIHTLNLDGLFLNVDDADLEEISRIWPKLHTLNLDIASDDDYQSQISFQGLAHLRTLKHLETVSLTLSPYSTISESMLSLSTPSNSPIKHITIHGIFPPVPPYSAAMFLTLHFPNLKSINTSHVIGQGERERMKELQTLLDGVRPMMENVRSVYLSLRSSAGVEKEDGGA